MKILLLGANGYLGARLYDDLRKMYAVLGTYHTHQFSSDLIQLDITNEREVEKIFHEYKPDIIIHPANHASPRPATQDPEGYTATNLHSTSSLQSAAEKVNAKFIFISSFAAIDPSDIYGQLKLQSEEIVKQTKSGYLILRPSLILGMSPNTQNDRPFNRVLKCMNNPTAVAAFDTSWRFQPTYIGHISEVIMAAIEKEIWNHLVHVFCPSVQTQYSTARDILHPFGVPVTEVDKKITAPLQERDEKELTELGLPTCRYEEMLKKIHEEIGQWKKVAA